MVDFFIPLKIAYSCKFNKYNSATKQLPHNYQIIIDIFAAKPDSALRILLSVISFLLSSAILTAEAQDIPSPIKPVMPLFRTDTLTICVLGDIMMHTRQIESALQKDGTYDFSSYFSLIHDRILSADIAIANMEFTLSGKPYTGYPAFSAPDCYAEYLAECGFDIFLTANNHIFDKGSKGAERTLGIYRTLGSRYGIHICGLAEDQKMRDHTMPLKLTRKGIRLAFLNFTYGTNLGSDRQWPKTNYMNEKSLISEALAGSKDCDLTVVLPHWGTEYSLKHSLEQEKLSVMLAENGADIIIGSHPHVPQDFGTVSDRKVPVVYSLGNAVSNMSAPDTQVGLMAEIRIIRKTNGDVNILPIDLTYLWCSRPGGYSDSYTVIPIKSYIGKRDMWKGEWDYDKMVSSYKRVQEITGIEDN